MPEGTLIGAYMPGGRGIPQRRGGCYSRIPGTCTLDLDVLGRQSPAEVAGAGVRCATEGWLRRSGRGRSRVDEARILAVSELARPHFLRRAVKRLGASR